MLRTIAWVIFFLYIFIPIVKSQNDFPLVTLTELYDEVPNVANCYEGKLKASEKQKILQALNYIRQIHGLKPVEYHSGYDKEVAKSALITVANSLLDHFPKSSYHCYTQDGYNGSSTSNLYIFAGSSPSMMPTSEYSLQAWMIDYNVTQLGHRRALLNPFLKYTSFGRVDGYPKTNNNYFVSGMSIKVYGFPSEHNLSDWNQEFIAYPYQEYPASYFDSRWYLSFTVIADKSNIWNNGQNKVDFSQAKVKITDPNNQNIAVSNLKFDYIGAGVPNCLYWLSTSIQKNVRYTVTISDVRVGGQNKTYTYWFRLTDAPSTTIQPPTLLSPPDNSTEVETQVTLSWSSVSGAQTYSLQVSKNIDFNNTIVNLTNLTTTSYLLSNLEPKTKYYWRVKAHQGQEQSSWSSVYSFTTKDAPLLAPGLFEPLPEATSISLRPKFVWGRIPMAEKYHLQANLSEDFDDFSMQLNEQNITDTSYQALVNFFPKTLYYWRVRAIRGTQSGGWSQVWKFWTLDPTTVEEQMPSSNSALVIDNEMSSIIFIGNFDKPKKITLYNLFGKRFCLSENSSHSNYIQIPYSQLTQGLWYLQISLPNENYLVKLLIIK